MDKAALARRIDHTCLKPDATEADIERLCAEARALGVGAVVVSPRFVPLAARLLAGSDTAVGTVVGFPTGMASTQEKCDEAARALGEGAVEIDMVARLDLALADAWDEWVEDVRAVEAVVHARPGRTLKVIIESAALDDDRLARAAALAADSGSDLVKTSTGFHPAGGATPRAVALVAEAVDGRAGVKASGGIRAAAQVRDLLDAGATRIGTSAAPAILTEWDAPVPGT